MRDIFQISLGLQIPYAALCEMDGLVALQIVLEKLPMEQAQPAAQSVISHFQLDPSSVVQTLVDEFYLASTTLGRSKGSRGQTRPLMPAPCLRRSFSDYVALAKSLKTLVGNEAERLEGEAKMDDAVQVDLFLLAYSVRPAQVTSARRLEAGPSLRSLRDA